METYRKAYESYISICKGYGMESINFHHFIKTLTEEQLEQYSKLAIGGKGRDNNYGSSREYRNRREIETLPVSDKNR